MFPAKSATALGSRVMRYRADSNGSPMEIEICRSPGKAIVLIGTPMFVSTLTSSTAEKSIDSESMFSLNNSTNAESSKPTPFLRLLPISSGAMLSSIKSNERALEIELLPPVSVARI